jgi:hypothetical protein
LALLECDDRAMVVFCDELLRAAQRRLRELREIEPKRSLTLASLSARSR